MAAEGGAGTGPDPAGPGQETRSPRWRPRWPVVAVVALAATSAVVYLIVASPGSAPRPSSASPSRAAAHARPARPSPTPSPALPFGVNSSDVSGYVDVCVGSAFSGAAAYTGPGPHPIAIFGLGSLEWMSGILPTDNTGVLDPWYATDVQQVQLVACVTVTDGPVVQSCGDYLGQQSVAVTVVWGDYSISLYRANNAAPVAPPIHLRGDQSTSCPTITQIPANTSRYAIPTELSGAQVKQALAHYVG